MPDGVLRRTARLSGSLLVEIRLYDAEQVRGLEGLERCEKALVWLKLQGDSNTPEFVGIKKVINQAKARFTEEGTFYADKKRK